MKQYFTTRTEPIEAVAGEYVIERLAYHPQLGDYHVAVTGDIASFKRRNRGERKAGEQAPKGYIKIEMPVIVKEIVVEGKEIMPKEKITPSVEAKAKAVDVNVYSLTTDQYRQWQEASAAQYLAHIAAQTDPANATPYTGTGTVLEMVWGHRERKPRSENAKNKHEKEASYGTGFHEITLGVTAEQQANFDALNLGVAPVKDKGRTAEAAQYFGGTGFYKSLPGGFKKNGKKHGNKDDHGYEANGVKVPGGFTEFDGIDAPTWADIYAAQAAVTV